MGVLSSSTADVAYIRMVSQVHVSNLTNCFGNKGRKIIWHKAVFHLEEENEFMFTTPFAEGFPSCF